jgi:hypothetical protein
MKSKTWSLVIIALVLMACSLPVNGLGTEKNIAPTESFPSIAVLPSATIPVCPTCPPPPPSPTPMIVTETKETLPTETPTFLEPSQTPTAIPTLSNIRYQAMPNSPFYLQNYAHPDKGCQWMGVAGQVLNSVGVPQNDLVIVVEGTLNSNPIELLALTGLSDQYGLGGFEVEISNQVIASQGTLKLTVYDVNGNVLANPVSFDTIADCQKNLILINFQQIPNP